MNCNREAFMSSGVTLMWHMYYCHTKTWILARMLPWCAKSLQEGDNCWDIDNPPERDLNLREQNWHRDGEAVVDECHCMSSNLPDEEEIVPQVNFTPQWHFLHNKKKLYLSANAVILCTCRGSLKRIQTLFSKISTIIFLNRFAGPHDHLCCWNLYALNVLGSSLLT